MTLAFGICVRQMLAADPFLICYRWTLVVPSGWAMAFWVPLIYAGAHAVGQRELHWVATEVCPSKVGGRLFKAGSSHFGFD